MKNIFDTNARANEALMGGASATRAAGLPTPNELPGTMAPGGSNDTADSLLSQMKQRTQGMREQYARPEQVQTDDPIVGYNSDTKQVFSGGKTFKLDLDEGRQNAALLDVNNTEFPVGFQPLQSSQAKAKLIRDYENLGMVDSVQRRVGQAIDNYGSTIEDLGAETVGQAMQDFGGAQAARNPSKITSASDLIDKPGTTVSETVGELGYDLPVAIGTTAAGAIAGAKLGAIAAPFTGGASIPIGAILGGFTARFLTTLGETYGSVRSEQRDKGIDARGAALSAGVGSATIEAVFGPEARIGTQLAKKTAQQAGKEFIEQGAAKSARDLLKQGGAKYGANKALQDFAVEGGTEIAQTAMERAGAFSDLTGPDAFDEYAIAGVKGGIGGAVVSPLASMSEYQDAKNFVVSLQEDMATAADTAAPSAQRLQAAKRVQAVLRGSSDDPEFDAVLSEFRQKLSFIDTQITANATKQALADGTPVNLMDAEQQPDMFNRGMDAAPDAATAQEDGVQIQQADLAQGSLFDGGGEPTYQAAPSFGE